MTAFPTIFVSHGAPTLAIEPGLIGPRLAAFSSDLPKPRAILVLYEFRQGQDTPATYVKAFAFWVRETLERGDLDALLDYRSRAPHAERAHPTEDHLLPLFFALGAAGNDSVNVRCIEGGITHGILAMDAFVLGNGGSGTATSAQSEPQHAAA